MRLINTIERNLRKLNKEEVISNDEIRPFIINQYRKLKLAGFTEEEIKNCVILNDKEREEMDKEFNLLDSTKADISNSIADLAMNELDNDNTDNNTEEEIVEVEEVVDKEEKDDKVILSKEEKDKAKDMLPVEDNEKEEVKEEKEEVKEEKEVKNESEEKEVKNESEEKEVVKEEKEVKDLTDEEIIDKAIKEQLEVITSEEEKLEMEKILRKSFKENKELVEIYRNKYNATSRLNSEQSSTNSNDNNTESEEDYVYLNIAPEELDDLINDIKDDYDNDYGVKTNKAELRSIIIDILDKNEDLLKATTYGELYCKTKEILDNMIDSNTVEMGNDNKDELLQDLNAIFDIK